MVDGGPDLLRPDFDSEIDLNGGRTGPRYRQTEPVFGSGA